MSLYNLESIFKPGSVAVIGASEKKGTIGRALMENLVQAEFAVIVGDPWQGKGVGAELLIRCLRIVKKRGMQSVYGTALSENRQMLKLARKIGFQISQSSGGNEYDMTLDLKNAEI